MDKHPTIKEQGSFYYNKLAEYGRDHYEYKECVNCKGPYFCGLKSCAAAIADRHGDDENKDEGWDEALREALGQKEAEEEKAAEAEEKVVLKEEELG